MILLQILASLLGIVIITITLLSGVRAFVLPRSAQDPIMRVHFRTMRQIFHWIMARQVVVPNADLKPEYTYNFDLTLNQGIANRVNIELTGYYTLFRNAILKAPFKLNGQDSIVYNGVKSLVLASQNETRQHCTVLALLLLQIFIKGLPSAAPYLTQREVLKQMLQKLRLFIKNRLMGHML